MPLAVGKCVNVKGRTNKNTVEIAWVQGYFCMAYLHHITLSGLFIPEILNYC